MTGRTSWWAKDAAWHRRELQVELGEEFGAAGPHILDVLCCWAQEQKATGSVRGGFRALSREAFVDADRVKVILERAAVIGAVDDLVIDNDGRRFTCRVSGFRGDQERGRAAWRKAAQRGRETDADQGPEPNEDGLVTVGHGPSRHVTESPPPDQTTPMEGEGKRASTRASALHPDLTAVLAILEAAPGLVVEAMAVDSACRAHGGRDVVAAANIVASWAHEGGLQITSASRLLHRALDRQTTDAARRDRALSTSRPPAARAGRLSAEERAAALEAEAAAEDRSAA